VTIFVVLHEEKVSGYAIEECDADNLIDDAREECQQLEIDLCYYCSGDAEVDESESDCEMDHECYCECEVVKVVISR
jgi:hypothetical protein